MAKVRAIRQLIASLTSIGLLTIYFAGCVLWFTRSFPGTFLFILLFLVFCWMSGAANLYYRKKLILMVQGGGSAIAAYLLITYLLKSPIYLWLCFWFLIGIIVWVLGTKCWFHSQMAPADSILIYDSPEHKEMAQRLLEDYPDAAVKACEYFLIPTKEKSVDWMDLVQLEKEIKKYYVTQALLCLDDKREEIIHVCKRNGLSLMMEGNYHLDMNAGYTLHPLEWFKNRYFTSML